MAYLPAGCDSWIHGARCPMAGLSSSTRRLSAANPTEPAQEKSLGFRWLDIGNKKRLPASQSASVRRSPRSHPTSITAPMAAPNIEAPSQLAASHHSLRPQLLFRPLGDCRRLYGTAQHRGIRAGLTILKLYCECLGTTWTGSPARDPIVFFRTVDMADSSRWKRLPAEFDRHQAKAYSFTVIYPTWPLSQSRLR